MNKEKCLNLLSSTVLGAVIAFTITTTAHAKVTSYIANDGGKIISFNSDSLIADYTNKLLGQSSPMYDEYLKEARNLVAFQDSVKGFVSSDSVEKAYEDALTQGNGGSFNIDSVTENASASNIENITVGYQCGSNGTISGNSSNTDKTINSVNTIIVPSTTVGTVPTLPSAVSVTLSDGTNANATITWNSAATLTSTYASAEQVTISGTLADYSNYAVSAIVTVNASSDNVAKGQVKILSVTPDNNLTPDADTTFKVTVSYSFDGIDQAIVLVGFNNETVDIYNICDKKIVTEKSGQCTFSVTTKVKDWGNEGNFSAYANISEYPHPNNWKPIAYNEFNLGVNK